MIFVLFLLYISLAKCTYVKTYGPPYLELNKQTTDIASTQMINDESAESTRTTLHTRIMIREKLNTASTPTLFSQDEIVTSRRATEQTTDMPKDSATPTTTVELRDASTASGQSLTSKPTITCFSDGTEFSILEQTTRDDNSIRFCGTQKLSALSKASPWVWRTYWLDKTPYSQQFVVSWITGCQDNYDLPITGDEKCNSALRDIGNTCKYGGYADIGCLRYLTIPQDNQNWIQMND
ncbi:hypothetical protein BGZ63DRAFT_171029 [Mariannaea sp. PMI_226]|nr:hypothetical protein BGZ63DRAFT_171029 [Mariannaea sp. PMI_226]